MIPRTWIRIFLLIVTLAGLLPAAQAPRFSLEDLLSGSQLIVHGRVVRQWCGWDGQHKYIWTHHEIAVAESVRGAGGGLLVVSEPGGELDGIGQRFSGALPYTVGETVLLFLERTPIGFYRAVGGGQGKFTIGRDGRARANTAGIDLVDLPGFGRGTPLSSIEGLPAGDLIQRVRASQDRFPYRVGGRR